MTLQDFRGQGPPGDIGTFQSPESIIVYQHTFSGTTYIIAARQGDRGWVLVSHGIVVATVINAAITALVATGGNIFVKAGAYTLTASLVDGGANDVWLEFESGAVFTAAAASNIPMIWLTAASDWDIINPQLDGNYANQTMGAAATGIGIECELATNVHVHGGRIYNQSQFGFYVITQSVNCGISDCVLIDNQWNNMTLGGGDLCYDLYAVNNWCHGGSDVGIALYGARCRVIDNHVEDVDNVHGNGGGAGSSWGIGAEGGYGNVISNNTISGAITNGIVLGDTFENNVVVGNYVHGTLETGIGVFGDYNLIDGNQILEFDRANTWKNGLSLNGDYNMAVGNVIRSAEANSMAVDISGTGNSLVSNYLYGVGAIINSFGAASKIINNQGWNPRGNIATPWRAAAGELDDTAQAQDNPSTHVTYTVSCSPKMVILTNTAGVTGVIIDGVTLTNMTTQTPQIYKLHPGQTIHVDWATTTPHGEVFAE